MRLRILLVCCAALALTAGVATAFADGGGNSGAAKACQKGGWQTLVRSDGSTFYNQDDCVSYGPEDLDDFTICRGEPVTTAAHVAFSAEGRHAVDAFFAAAVANGATVRGEPGVWTQYSERYYAAFVNDLHQNNVEAVWHAPEPVVDAPRRPGVP